MHVRVSARATKEESRCEVRPTLSPSKSNHLSTGTSYIAIGSGVFGGETSEGALGRGEGKVPVDDGLF